MCCGSRLHARELAQTYQSQDHRKPHSVDRPQLRTTPSKGNALAATYVPVDYTAHFIKGLVSRCCARLWQGIYRLQWLRTASESPKSLSYHIKKSSSAYSHIIDYSSHISSLLLPATCSLNARYHRANFALAIRLTRVYQHRRRTVRRNWGRGR